jgi:hypothetical protein
MGVLLNYSSLNLSKTYKNTFKESVEVSSVSGAI